MIEENKSVRFSNIFKKIMIFVIGITVPGMGQFILKKYKYFLIFFTLNIFFSLLQRVEGSFWTFPMVLLCLAATVLIFIMNTVNLWSNLKGPYNSENNLHYSFIIIFLICFISFFVPEITYKMYRMASGSMEPTILNSERIVIIRNAHPKRGDLVVFKYPKDKSISFMHRLIGIPGDKIKIINKEVFINGNKVDAQKLDNPSSISDISSQFKDKLFEIWSNHLNGREFITLNDLENPYKIDFEAVTVPNNMYYVLGDNRDFSLDSRYWGFVPAEDILGVAKFIFYSQNFSRIGKNIH